MANKKTENTGVPPTRVVFLYSNIVSLRESKERASGRKSPKTEVNISYVRLPIPSIDIPLQRQHMSPPALVDVSRSVA
jgi:hypothetical protein